MIYSGKISNQEFADAVMLSTFISLKFNLDPFLLVASPIRLLYINDLMHF